MGFKKLFSKLCLRWLLRVDRQMMDTDNSYLRAVMLRLECLRDEVYLVYTNPWRWFLSSMNLNGFDLFIFGVSSA
jgi:hypothetical protein